MMLLKDGLLSQIGEKSIITLFKYLTGTMFILIREDRLRRSPLQAQMIQVTGSRLEAIAYPKIAIRNRTNGRKLG